MNMTIALLSVLALLAACETTKGFGRDLSKVGNNIAESADRHTTNTTTNSN
jgi:predicted small secreted protein